MSRSQIAFAGVASAYPHLHPRADTNPVADSYVRRNFGTTPQILTELFTAGLPRGTDAPIRMLECGQRVELGLACPNPAGTRNIAEVTCFMNGDSAFQFQTIKLAESARGLGLGHKIVRNSLDIAEELGAASFEVTAGLTHGASFWTGLNIRPNGNQFDFTFKTPLQDRVKGLAPFLDSQTQSGLQDALQMPYTILPQEILNFRQDVRFVTEPSFQPTPELLHGFRAMFPDSTPSRARPQIFREHASGLVRRDGSLPLSSLLMSEISYDAELNMEDNDAVRAVRNAISARLLSTPTIQPSKLPAHLPAP